MPKSLTPIKNPNKPLFMLMKKLTKHVMSGATKYAKAFINILAVFVTTHWMRLGPRFDN